MLVFTPMRCRASFLIGLTVLCAEISVSRVAAQDCCEGTIRLTPPATQDHSTQDHSTHRDPSDVVDRQLPVAVVNAPAEADPDTEIRSTLAAYVAAFNRKDSSTLATHWVVGGVFIDQGSGQQTVGREAIASRFVALFDQRDDLKLEGRLDTIRFVRPDVARVTGYTVSMGDDQEPLESQFTAILIRDEGRWLFDTIDESPLPETSSPETTVADDPLANLEFLVGRWIDEDGDSRTETTATWGIDRSFFVRYYKIDRGDDELIQGTQVIGWDPRGQRIRCWMFNSDGSFGDGIWSSSENGWTVKFTQTLTDGSIAGATQAITVVDQDTLSIRMVGQEVEGVTSPSSNPVRAVRVRDADETNDQ